MIGTPPGVSMLEITAGKRVDCRTLLESGQWGGMPRMILPWISQWKADAL